MGTIPQPLILPLQENGLQMEKITQLTARGLSVPAAKPIILLNNDSKLFFKAQYDQRLGILLVDRESEDCTHKGLCPNGIVPTQDCAHTELCHTGLCPHRIVPTWDCAYSGLFPHGIVHTPNVLEMF